jgi:small subunit ribosomal protein S16
MAVHIRLARAGTKKKPFYRVVVTDQRSPRGGRFLENIGTFDPAKEMKAENGKTPLQIDQARLDHWKGRGAQPSETLGRLLKASAKATAAAAAK